MKTEEIEQLLSKKKQIGKGATATAYKVNNCFTNKGSLCLKILNDEFFKHAKKVEEEEEEEEAEIDMEKVKQLYLEFEILNQLIHPNIIKIYGFYFGDKDHSPAILLEFCKTSLDKALKQLSDVDLVGVIYEICSAMNYIHKCKIIHRDLKLTNILINNKNHIKICDFGIAKVFDLETLTSISHGVGTIAFMAPEMFDDETIYDGKVDVYSFGVVMYLILTRQTKPKFSKIGCYESLKLPKTINELSRSIIKSCWSNSPKVRPSFSDILDLIVKNNFMLVDGIEKEIPKLREHLGLK